MGNFAYLTHDDNLAATATLTLSSEDSNYPEANLTGLPIAKCFRFTGDTSESVLIDLGSAQDVDFAGIINHNLTSGATITLEAGTTVAVSDYSTSISYREFDAFKLLSAAESYRYWKITIADASNPDAFIEIGYLMLGNATTLAFNYRYGGEQIDEFVNSEAESEYGVPHVAELYNRVHLAFPFGALIAANFATLRTVFRGVKRNVTPLFVVPDSAVNTGYFGRLTNNLREDRSFHRSGGFSFVEDSRGDRIGT